MRPYMGPYRALNGTLYRVPFWPLWAALFPRCGLPYFWALSWNGGGCVSMGTPDLTS